MGLVITKLKLCLIDELHRLLTKHYGKDYHKNGDIPAFMYNLTQSLHMVQCGFWELNSPEKETTLSSKLEEPEYSINYCPTCGAVNFGVKSPDNISCGNCGTPLENYEDTKTK